MKNEKKIKRPKGTTIAIVLLAVSTVVSTICAVGFYFMYAYESGNSKQYQIQLDEANTENETLKNNNELLQSENNSLRDENDTLQSANERQRARISDLSDELNSRPAYVPYVSNSSPISTSTEKVCAVPSCNRSVLGNKIYCSQHGCLMPTCLNFNDDTLSPYCRIHRR